MEDVLEKLAHVQMVQPVHDLYPDIVEKIRRQQLVSSKWVLVVAAALALFLTAEFFITQSHQTKQADLSYFVTQNNYILYND
jgi:hypothetical protein